VLIIHCKERNFAAVLKGDGESSEEGGDSDEAEAPAAAAGSSEDVN